MAAPIVVVTGPCGVGKTTVARLVAAAFDASVHLRMDDFSAFAVNGWLDPGTAESAHQDDVFGGAVAAAAMQFAHGGYTVLVDGHIFPEGLAGLAQACLLRGVPLHYAVLRADVDTCRARVYQRRADDPVDPGSLDRLHARFTDLGDHEANVIDASAEPDAVATAVLVALAGGRLVEVELIGGVEQRTLELVEHDPAWASRFESERRRIRTALGEDTRVEHIGSTAVPDLVAKPIVDIQVGVADVRDEASYVPALVAVGYELRVRERRHRMLRTPDRDVHVHVCDAGRDWERRHLAFRDRLRSSPSDRDRYGSVKRTLAAQAWSSVNEYAAAKTGVIAEIMGRAAANGTC